MPLSRRLDPPAHLVRWWAPFACHHEHIISLIIDHIALWCKQVIPTAVVRPEDSWAWLLLLAGTTVFHKGTI